MGMIHDSLTGLTNNATVTMVTVTMVTVITPNQRFKIPSAK